MVDIFGRTIRQGDYVTYSTRQGSNLGVHVGRVMAVGDTGGVTVSRIDLWNKGLTRPSALSLRSRVTLVDDSVSEQLDALFDAVSLGNLSVDQWRAVHEWLWTPGAIPNIE